MLSKATKDNFSLNKDFFSPKFAGSILVVPTGLGDKFVGGAGLTNPNCLEHKVYELSSPQGVPLDKKEYHASKIACIEKAKEQHDSTYKTPYQGAHEGFVAYNFRIPIKIGKKEVLTDIVHVASPSTLDLGIFTSMYYDLIGLAIRAGGGKCISLVIPGISAGKFKSPGHKYEAGIINAEAAFQALNRLYEEDKIPEGLEIKINFCEKNQHVANGLKQGLTQSLKQERGSKKDHASRAVKAGKMPAKQHYEAGAAAAAIPEEQSFVPASFSMTAQPYAGFAAAAAGAAGPAIAYTTPSPSGECHNPFALVTARSGNKRPAKNAEAFLDIDHRPTKRAQTDGDEDRDRHGSNLRLPGGAGNSR